MPVVVAAVIKHEGKLLLAQRKKGDSFELRWEFPGGKVEADETFEIALARELKEEFAVDADIGAFLCSNSFDYRYVFIEILVYVVTRMTGRMALNAHEQIAWVTPETCTGYDLLDADVPIVQVLRERWDGIPECEMGQ